jgi:hypothetical protein
VSTDVVDFTCPRCAAEVAEAFYGPCESCRGELVVSMSAEARDVETAAYEPKMNVVPNQIATKD